MQPSNTQKRERGFVALTSALIICAVLTLLMFSTSQSSFFARFDAQGGEYKRISLGLSESCTNAALLKIAQDYNYTPALLGDTVSVGPDQCLIKSVSYGAEDPVTHRKQATIVTTAKYPTFGGSWSTTKIKATIQNPTVSVIAPSPACTLTAFPTSVPAGQTVLLQWNTVNTSAFQLDHGPVTGLAVPSGSYTTAPTSGSGAVTYTGTATGPGGNAQCTATYTVVPPPPTPACADTVMMLDRTGSMTSTDLTNERTAANQLVDLYAAVTSMPKIGAGSFPGVELSNWASVPISPYGRLPATFPAVAGDYPILKSTINSMTANTTCSNPYCGTDIWSAIMAGVNELNSVRHNPTFQKVLILVSDGEANHSAKPGSSGNFSDDALSAADTAKVNGVSVFSVRYSQDNNNAARLLMAQLASGNVPVAGHRPGADDSSTAPATSGFLFPTTAGVNPHALNQWTNGSNALTNDSTYAADSTNNHQENFANFHFNVPAGSVITGIEATVDGLVGSASVNTGNLAPNAVGNFDTWNRTGGTSKPNAVSTNDTNTSYISMNTLNNAETFSVPNSAVPAGATINYVSVTAVAASSAACAGATCPIITIRAEKGTTPANISDGTQNTLPGTGYISYTRTMFTNPFTSLNWTLAEVNAWTTKFGVVKANTNGTARVTQLFVVVNYTPTAAGSCQLGVSLWNTSNGNNWTSAAHTVTLTGTESNLTASTGATDLWGKTWQQSDFADGSFGLRLNNNTCSGGTAASVNYVTVQVNYSAYDPNAENTDGDNYFITPATNLASIQSIFNTIGKQVCPAAAPQCSNTVDDDSDSLTDSADPVCHTDGNASNAASYDPTKNDEWGSAGAPPGTPAAPPLPPPISIGSWDEVVNPSP